MQTRATQPATADQDARIQRLLQSFTTDPTDLRAFRALEEHLCLLLRTRARRNRSGPEHLLSQAREEARIPHLEGLHLVAEAAPLGLVLAPLRRTFDPGALDVCSGRGELRLELLLDRKSTRLNSSHFVPSRMPSSA